jgi:hypothetical protein
MSDNVDAQPCSSEEPVAAPLLPEEPSVPVVADGAFEPTAPEIAEPREAEIEHTGIEVDDLPLGEVAELPARHPRGLPSGAPHPDRGVPDDLHLKLRLQLAQFPDQGVGRTARGWGDPIVNGNEEESILAPGASSSERMAVCAPLGEEPVHPSQKEGLLARVENTAYSKDPDSRGIRHPVEFCRDGARDVHMHEFRSMSSSPCARVRASSVVSPKSREHQERRSAAPARRGDEE